MTSLFPETGEGFRPKKEEGVLANYCANCNQRLEAHKTVWLTAQGSLRVCPPVEERIVRELPPPEPEERKQPLRPIRSPFGTDHNFDSFSRKGGRGHLVGVAGGGNTDHLHGAACESDFIDDSRPSVPCQSFNHSHLRGAGLHNVDTEPKRVPVPCQRTNDSHLRGASVNPVFTHDIHHNTAKPHHY